MASAAPLKDIDEQFLQCCICMDQLKEPKLLPCLHRYCRDCLKKIIKDEGRKIECPTCREEHTLPEGGVDGLKTDFNTKNIVEFIQLQISVKQEPQKVCAGCTNTLKVSAYCFKCSDFLCQGCYEYHTTIKILKDHRNHVFSLSDVEARNLTVEKLSSLKEPPRCHHHPQKISELCCTSCGNLPICVPCTYGAHQGHDLKEVSTQAVIERERLNVKVAELMQYEDKIHAMQEQIRNAEEKLHQNVNEEKKKLQGQLDVEEETTKRDIRDTDEKLKKRQAALEEQMRKKTLVRKEELEKVIREAQEKYDKICKEERQEADNELKIMQEECEKENAKLQEGLDTMNKNIKELLASLNSQEEEKSRTIKELSDHFTDIKDRLQTVTKTTSSIHAARNDWADVQCIPDICAVIDPLIEEVKNDHPELAMLSDIMIGHLSPISGSRSKVISDREESVVDIEGISNGWLISGITSGKNGNIILTGKTSGGQSYFTVTQRNGVKIRQDIVTATSLCYCGILSHSRVASVCQNKEIGIYDTRDGTYRKANFIGSGSAAIWTSVAVDITNRQIIVGGRKGRNLFVYNEQLEYSHTLKLPNGIKNLYGIAFHGGNLLACDDIKGKAYSIMMKEGSGCKIMYEFGKPDGTEDSFPCSVCTDKNGHIYILWCCGMKRSIFVQYSQDGGKVLMARFLDEKYYGQCISVVNTEEGEKLVMATWDTGKLVTYGLK